MQRSNNTDWLLIYSESVAALYRVPRARADPLAALATCAGSQLLSGTHAATHAIAKSSIRYLLLDNIAELQCQATPAGSQMFFSTNEHPSSPRQAGSERSPLLNPRGRRLLNQLLPPWTTF